MGARHRYHRPMTHLQNLLGLGSGLLVLAFGGLAGCSSDDDPAPSTSSQDAGTGTGSGTGTGTGTGTGSGDSGSASLGAPTWTNVYAKVLSVSCTSCHGAIHETGLVLGTKATAYASLVAVKANGAQCKNGTRTRVVANDAEASLLWTKINGTQDCGDKMPLGGTKLSQAKIDLVKAWIEAGAKDD